MLHPRSLLLFITVCFLCLATSLQAKEYDYDPDNGEEINEICSGCHGEFGQGGKDGEYPRIAAQPIEFIMNQLRLFRDRKRKNFAMVEYIDERQMPENDMYDIARYLSEIKLKTRMSIVDENAPDFDAYARLLESKMTMQIPKAPGNIERGKKIYNKECDSCHGKEGLGDHKKAVPMLSGQYTNYLWKQVKQLRTLERIHDEDSPKEELLNEFSDEDLTDIFAYLSIVDD
ncbi:MAG: c-type cytochrome [Sedimenticola thiotaurini]|uniref:C-type cytochrome n=1 Tax=Sedimenticola thiotaurini TaxID=1543721 RepID=A0A558DAF3_9GAMM|nr:MAG: c-type cytochrome [Sedimenticola thiotaurini]